MAACGHAADLEHLVTQGVRLARRAAQEGQLVALSLGPTGDFLAPYGALTPDTLAEAFTRPLRAGQAAGADFAMLETQCDLAEARAALLAANALSFPAVVSFTFEPVSYTHLDVYKRQRLASSSTRRAAQVLPIPGGP